jgi:hypothetical protein
MSDPAMRRFTPFTPKAVYARAAHFDGAAVGVLMQAYEWEFVLALDGFTPAGDIARTIGLDVAYLEALCDHLQALGLVTLCQVTLDEYLQQKKTAKPDLAVPAIPDALPDVVFRASSASSEPVVAEPVYEIPPATAEQPEHDLPPDAFTPLPAEAPEDGTPTMHTVIRPERSPATEEARPLAFSLKRQSTGMPIRPLLDFIVQRAGGSSVPKLLQQLAVYRVFRKVPSDLVLAGNLPTLSLTDANFDLQSRELYDAIVRAIEETFGVPYSDDTSNVNR